MEDKKTSFWKDGLSIDETRMSVLIITYLGAMIFAGWMYFAHKDITDNFRVIIMTLIASIAGVNITSQFVDAITYRSRQQQPMDNQPDINDLPPINPPVGTPRS